MEKAADNSGAASGEGTFTVSFKLNPWSLDTSDFGVMDIGSIETDEGNGSLFGGVGTLMRLRLQKDGGATNRVSIFSTSRIMFGGGTTSSGLILFDAADSDGFIDISYDITLTDNGANSWTTDWTQTTTYAGNTIVSPQTDTRVFSGFTGLQGITGYTLGLIGENTAVPTGTLTFDDFEVAGIPEPGSIALLTFAGLALFFRRRRA